jgi:hypothetical protein
MCFGSHDTTLADQAQNNANAISTQEQGLINQYAVPALQNQYKNMQVQSANQGVTSGYLSQLLNQTGNTLGSNTLPTYLQTADANDPYTPAQKSILQQVGAMNVNAAANKISNSMAAQNAQRGITNSSAGNALPAQLQLYKNAGLASNNANILQSGINYGNQIRQTQANNISNLMNQTYASPSSQISSVTNPLSSLLGNYQTSANNYATAANSTTDMLGDLLGQAIGTYAGSQQGSNAKAAAAAAAADG